MQYKKPYAFFAFFILVLFSVNTVEAQPLQAHAGNPQTVCKGDSVIPLGAIPSATGGTPPYTYSWTPVAGLNNPADPNPDAKVNVTTKYFLTVTDASLTRAFDSVVITVDPISNISAGAPATICMFFDSAAVGSAGNNGAYTYTWAPTSGITCTNCPFTYAHPSVTTTYTLTATDGSCSATSTVTITVLPPPVVSVTSPVSIDRGQSITLSETGLISNIQWIPTTNLSNPNIPDPVASPLVTTTYTVIGQDVNGCYGIDSIVVDVTNDSNLIFYNTFTPNGDGINDTWFIGNIDLYPQNEVLVYNRYGEQIYRANGYINQWDGTISGTNVPDATYYYIVYTGTGKTYTGSVTIIREPH